jgi:hypothetical protein
MFRYLLIQIGFLIGAYFLFESLVGDQWKMPTFDALSFLTPQHVDLRPPLAPNAPLVPNITEISSVGGILIGTIPSQINLPVKF